MGEALTPAGLQPSGGRSEALPHQVKQRLNEKVSAAHQAPHPGSRLIRQQQWLFMCSKEKRLPGFKQRLGGKKQERAPAV